LIRREIRGREHACELDAARLAVSKHIKTLEKAGLIRREIRGREHACELDAARLAEASTWLDYYAEFWSGRIDALEKHLGNRRTRGNP